MGCDKGEGTNLAGRGAGSSAAFVDSVSDERVLEIGCDAGGVLLLSFRLYDSRGLLTAHTDGFERFPDGLTVSCKGGELLLDVPSDLSAPFRYRLYNSAGLLLTWSDGVRTKIYPHLRMDGVARGWTPASA